MSAGDRWAPILHRRRLGSKQVWIFGLRDRRTGRETPVLITQRMAAARARHMEAMDDLLTMDEGEFAAHWLAGEPPAAKEG